jgi:putative transcriptional regulator
MRSQMVIVAHEVTSACEDSKVIVIPQSFDVATIRKDLNMSQQEFALAFGFTVRSVQNWEAKGVGHRQPQGPARVYLTVIKNDPQSVLKALAKSRFLLV